VLSLLLAISIAAFGAAPTNLDRADPKDTASFDYDTFIWINSILSLVYNNGNFAYDDYGLMGKTDGLYFPFMHPDDDKTVIYSAGIWLGAKVAGEIRVAVAEYSSEFSPGKMVDGQPEPDNARFRVYKIGEGLNLDGTPYDDTDDWNNWPVEDGAPIDDFGDPELTGDQMLWSVFNDADPSGHSNMQTDPLGVEIRHSTFGYSLYGAYRNVIFLKYTIINKGSNSLDSVYVSLWTDPDIGDASDDFVGCDTVLSLGYSYNDGSDATYGIAVPAVGFDFFQGPIVESPGDTAYLPDGVYPDYKELGMTSFNKYINGTDPQNSLETYNYMRGLHRDGATVIDPTTGFETLYWCTGDPVAGTGWLDQASADRRYMMSSGPFTMEPNDTQVVVAAVLAAQGDTPLSSITLLREIDQTAQMVYDANFDLPCPPESPTAYTAGCANSISIVWEDDAEGPENYLEDHRQILNQLYTFEGFNVYMADSPAGPWSRLETFDYDDDEMESAYGSEVGDWVDCEWNPLAEVWDCSAAQVPRIWDFARLYADINLERVIVQRGTNSGLSYGITLNSDPRDGTPFEQYHPYYFKVTSYGVNIQQVYAKDSVFFGPSFAGMLSNCLEGSAEPLEVVLTPDDNPYSREADHIAGQSNGWVRVEFLIPEDLTGHIYHVTFNEDGTWNLQDQNTGAWLLMYQTNCSGDYDYPIVEGMMVRVYGPDPGISWYDEDYHWMSEIDLGGIQAYMAGRNARTNENYRDFKIKFLANPWDTVPGPIIELYGEPYTTIRYLDTSSDTIWAYFTGGSQAEEELYKVSVPFAIYDLGDDFTNPADDTRLWPLLYDFYGDCRWHLDDYFIFLTRDIGGTNANIYGENFWSYPPHDGDSEYWGYDSGVPYSRHDWDYRAYGWSPYGACDFWNEGDSVIIVTTKPNTTSDIFAFSTSPESEPQCGDVNRDTVVDVDDIVFLIAYVFTGGPAPNPIESGDVDCSGDIDIDDVMYLVNYVFVGGNSPCDPNGDEVPDCYE